MRWFPALGVCTVVALLGACGHPGNSGAGPSAQVVHGDAMRGRDLVTRFECARCHTIAGVSPPLKEKQCTGCHADINAGKVTATSQQLARWQSKVAELGDVPSLVAVGRRYREDWVRQFLLAPHDLRPSLVQSMPRLPLTDQQAADIAAFLADGAPPDDGLTLPPSEAARGRELMDVKGCGLCHKMTGVPALQGAMLPAGVTLSDMPRAVRLAPDLRYARERWRASNLVSWLVDPQHVKADTVMPSMGLSESEARSVAAYLLTTPLGAPEVKTVPARLPLLDRKVTYDEVATRVFRRTCWHCHGEPDFERGDGGPGNSGGFGFKGRGLNLSDYTSTFAGLLDESGRRVSVFAPVRGTSGPSHLVEALLARQREEAGEQPAIRGMPLGLPALGAEEVQLVESWIAQGRLR